VANGVLDSTPLRADVAVVGAGAAGLYAALAASREGASVALISRSSLAESASYWAQGGIAAALDADDSPALHVEDTVKAGRGLGRLSAIEVLCAESPDRVRDLAALGVQFDADRHGALALGLEGGHSRRRVAHAGGSATGRRITRELSALVATDPRIEVLENTSANALWCRDGRCVGMLAESPAHGAGARERIPIAARATVLATGGAAALWERTTNPRGAIGAGMSLAHHAGAALADLEFVQFHPTAMLRDDEHDGFLITEAIRGEGALLLDPDGERFVDELAPRDQVALAVAAVRRERGDVRLDMRSIDMTHFPNVLLKLREAGVDPARDLVPVAPAAHYTMGGIRTDLDGLSTLPGLYAIGECACNGLHGANRLASNSLAECFVFGRRSALAALDQPALPAAMGPAPGPGPSPVPPPQTRAALWRLAGLQRDQTGLSELSDDPFPLARMIAACGLARRESRGAHQRSDHPDTDPALDLTHSVVSKNRAIPGSETWH
jgi:L-aspartate oxidase